MFGGFQDMCTSLYFRLGPKEVAFGDSNDMPFSAFDEPYDLLISFIPSFGISMDILDANTLVLAMEHWMQEQHDNYVQLGQHSVEVHGQFSIPMLDDTGCELGFIACSVLFHHNDKRKLVSNGVLSLPNNITAINGTQSEGFPALLSDIFPTKSLKNAASLCKRQDPDPMNGCFLPDTRMVSQLLTSPRNRLVLGASLWAENGKIRVFIQSDGGLCLWHYYGSSPTMYWRAPIKGKIANKNSLWSFSGGSGGLCTFSDDGNVCMGPVGSVVGHRLRMESDGNLVIYKGPTNSNPVWSSGTNYWPNNVVSKPCTGPIS